MVTIRDRLLVLFFLDFFFALFSSTHWFFLLLEIGSKQNMRKNMQLSWSWFTLIQFKPFFLPCEFRFFDFTPTVVFSGFFFQFSPTMTITSRANSKSIVDWIILFRVFFFSFSAFDVDSCIFLVALRPLHVQSWRCRTEDSLASFICRENEARK